MGKKAKKKIHKRPVQKPKKLESSKAIAKTENNERVETIISGKACKHLDKGIDLEKLNSQLGKSSVLQCQGCVKSGICGKKEKKGKAKHQKNKGGSKDLRHLPSGSIWVCLACGQLGCGGEEKGLSPNGHAWQHWLHAHHPYVVQCNESDSLECWCFLCKTTVQDNSVVDGEESLQLEALKLVQEKLLNQTMIDDGNGGAICSGENVLSDTENNQPQDLDGGSEDSCSRTGRHIVKGLMNLGNTCFFNSVVQNLLALDVLRDHFLKSGEFQEGPMTSALRKLYFETSSEGLGQGDLAKSKKGMKANGTINPNALFRAICDKASQFRGFQQQDSHELWRYLLDCLRTEELRMIKNGSVSLDLRSCKDNTDENTNHVPSTSDMVTLVDHVFDGQLCSTVCCCNCGHSSMVYEPFFDLQLQIPTRQTAEKASVSRYKGSSSPKAKLKNNAKTIKNGNYVGKRRSGFYDAQADVPSQEISPSCAEDRNSFTGERAENMSASQENIEWIEPTLQEDVRCNGSARQEDTGWNEFAPQEDNIWNASAPQEDNIWNASAPQEDTVWMDYLRSGSESDDILNQDICQTSENVQQLENYHVGINNLECGFIASDGSETEPPLLVVGDSDVLLLPYKEVDLISGQELQAKEDSLELAQEPEEALSNQFNVAVSCTDPESFDGFGQLFEEEEKVHMQKKEEGSEDFLQNAIGNYILCTDSSIVASETKKEDIETTVTPMSLDGCLIDFTRAELLTGENAWKCEKCYTKLVESSGKLEKREAKANRGMKTKKRSTVGSANSVSDASSIGGTQIDVEKEQKIGSQDKVRDAEPKDSPIKNSSGLSALKADNSEFCSDTIRCSDIDASVRGNRQGMNEPKLDHAGLLSSLCFADSEQQSDQEVHQMETAFRGKENIPVNVSLSVPLNDSSVKRVLCSQVEDCSNENLSRTYGVEFREGIDGITQAERSASTNVVPKSEGITANVGHNVHTPKHNSAGKGHVLDKRKPKKTELHPNAVKQEAIKRYLISKAPSVLVIQLKRFTQDLWGRLSKLSGHVTFQERLDIRPYLDPRCPDKDGCVYHLRGVVEHMGTMKSGHYVAYVRCYEDENDQDAGRNGKPEKSLWYYASDSHVRRISFSEVLQSEAYLLFYEKHILS